MMHNRIEELRVINKDFRSAVKRFKAKYLSRKGSPGSYSYIYDQPKGEKTKTAKPKTTKKPRSYRDSAIDSFGIIGGGLVVGVMALPPLIIKATNPIFYKAKLFNETLSIALKNKRWKMSRQTIISANLRTPTQVFEHVTEVPEKLFKWVRKNPKRARALKILTVAAPATINVVTIATVLVVAAAITFAAIAWAAERSKRDKKARLAYRVQRLELEKAGDGIIDNIIKDVAKELEVSQAVAKKAIFMMVKSMDRPKAIMGAKAFVKFVKS